MNNLTSDYSRHFYKYRANDVEADYLPSAVANKILAEGQPLTDIKNFLLGTSDYVNDIQSDIDLYVTRGRHNEASFRRKLDPIEKSVWRLENPLDLLFKDVANFDAQNLVIGSLLRKIDLGKNNTKSSLISTAPDINGTILLQRFKNILKTPINYNDNDNDDDDDDNNTNNNQNNNYNNIFLSPPQSPINLGSIFETPLAPSFNFNNDNFQQQQQQQQQ